jgi:hypothetical protein
MKPVQQPNVSPPVLPMSQPQQITDEQVIQILNKIRTKANAAQICLDEIVGETTNLFISVLNQKNAEIRELKETLVKKEIVEKGQ